MSWEFTNMNIKEGNTRPSAFYISHHSITAEDNTNPLTRLFLGTCTWVIIFTNLVPISLIVQLELCKLG